MKPRTTRESLSAEASVIDLRERENFVTGSTPVGATVDVERLYDQHAVHMVAFARHRFGIPVEEAEALVHDVFVNFIRYSEEVDNPRAWLIGAIVKASCYHLRKSGKVDVVVPAKLEELGDPASAGIEQLHRSVLVQQLLEPLDAHCRDLLRLHYLEGRTASEIAMQMGTTEGYAKKMIHQSLVQVRELYRKLRGTT